MTLSEWVFEQQLMVVLEAQDEIREVVTDLNKLRKHWDDDLEFFVNENGELEAWVSGLQL